MIYIYIHPIIHPPDGAPPGGCRDRTDRARASLFEAQICLLDVGDVWGGPANKHIT